jgi:tryptophan-rich sensory protein
MKNIIKLLLSIVICQAAGVIGAVFTFPEISNWYASLEIPSFSPPSWVFSPVWTILFLLMGISLFLIWKKGTETKGKRDAIIVFFFQLVLNTLWSIIFFGFHSLGGAFLEIIVLWLAIMFTIMQFYKISKLASLLLLPYIVWVSFAAILNLFIWQINI